MKHLSETILTHSLAAFRMTSALILSDSFSTTNIDLFVRNLKQARVDQITVFASVLITLVCHEKLYLTFRLVL